MKIFKDKHLKQTTTADSVLRAKLCMCSGRQICGYIGQLRDVGCLRKMPSLIFAIDQPLFVSRTGIHFRNNSLEVTEPNNI